ncbi:PCNA-associated factor-like [Thrips palmi]|uniref:PCNA-associated factor n=1 Tax=Thrips palmi TaxID=161013 RepID=A0A6P8YWN5_THRPL|nr:PCNA-associated factor-like [Thrips palmi]
MVRTKADTTGVKASGAKAPRKAVVSTPTRSSDSSGDSKGKPTVGGNSYHPRETPEWQKPITTFFVAPSSSSKESNGESASSNKSSPEGDS